VLVAINCLFCGYYLYLFIIYKLKKIDLISSIHLFPITS
jgi:hypothetical protein